MAGVPSDHTVDSAVEYRTSDEILQPFLLALHVSPLLLLSGPSSSSRNRTAWMTMFAVWILSFAIQRGS